MVGENKTSHLVLEIRSLKHLILEESDYGSLGWLKNLMIEA